LNIAKISTRNIYRQINPSIKGLKHMATLQQLLPYLEKGFSLQSVRGESIRPLPGSKTRIVWFKPGRWGGFEPENCNMSEMRNHTDMWEWGAVFVGKDGKNPFIYTEIAEIEEAIKNGTPRAVYGASEPEE
jgi:hypothetical protein